MNLPLAESGQVSLTTTEVSLAILLATGFGVVIAILHLLATRDKDSADL